MNPAHQLLLALATTATAVDLAKSSGRGARRLSSTASPSVWLSPNLIPTIAVDHILASLPKDEAAWTPCIGQTQEYASKRCTLLTAGSLDGGVLEKFLAVLEKSFNVGMHALRDGGLPIIRYLPGAPEVGVHGDIGATGLVPNATLVVYLTDADVDGGGFTYFPALDGVRVLPKAGSVLSFANVDGEGKPDPAAKHGVTRVSHKATSDRVVVQIPIANGVAYPEHVSGAKHKAHLAIMGLMVVGFIVYSIWKQGGLPMNLDGRL